MAIMTDLWNSGSQNYGLSGQSPFSLPFTPAPYVGYYAWPYADTLKYLKANPGVKSYLRDSPGLAKYFATPDTKSIFSGGISSTGQPIGGGGGGFTLGLGGYLGMLGPGATPGTPDYFTKGIVGAVPGTPDTVTPAGGGSVAGIPRPTFENNPGGSVTGFPYGSTPNPTLDDAIAGLFAKGLIPDIARQSAELVAGRGIAGSPASYSTAVRMSEADYLQRLALANTLLSGEAGRNLPYQITPYQRSQLELQRQQLELQRKALEQQQFNQALNNYYRYQGGYGGGRNAYGGGGGGYGGGRIGAPVSPYSSGGGTGFGNLGPGPFGSWSPASSLLSGGVTYGGGGNAFDLDAALQELGIGDNNGVTTEYGTDFGQFPEPPDFNYDMWD